VQTCRHVLKGESFLSWLEGKPVSGQRGRDDSKGVPRIASKSRGIRQARDDVEKFKDGARPTVHEQERIWLRSYPIHMQVVHIDVVQGHLELRKGIQSCFLLAPIEDVFPVSDEVAHIINAAAIGPWLAGGGIRQTRQGKTCLEIRNGRVGNVEDERFGRHDRSSLVVLFKDARMLPDCFRGLERRDGLDLYQEWLPHQPVNHQKGIRRVLPVGKHFRKLT